MNKMNNELLKYITCFALCFVPGFSWAKSKTNVSADISQVSPTHTHEKQNHQESQSVKHQHITSKPTTQPKTTKNNKALPKQTKKNTTVPIIKKNSVTYRLTVDYKTVNFTGKNKKAMLINDSLPAPTLFFKEGKKAIVYVTNKMDVETSIHWHGILLPNFQDGVPYLTTPPILPGKTHKFEFMLKQSGTYWYHSHTSLQEQRGLYGAIVVEPKQRQHKYNHDLVLVLSDWTNENPNEVLRTLKRGSEWYAIKKGSALSLSQVIAGGALSAQLKLWQQKMPGMDISDVYYDAFLINGEKEKHYPDFKPGDKIRLRVINASASTYFWLSFGGKSPTLISADGINVKPLPTNKILQAIAETYDFLITMPKGKAIEVMAMAQDGSGVTTATIGKGELLKAPLIPKPDPIQEMKKMADMHNGDGHHHHHSAPSSHNTHNTHSQHSQHSSHKQHKRTLQSITSHKKVSEQEKQNSPQKQHKQHSQHSQHSSHKQHSKHSQHKQHKQHSSHKQHSKHTSWSYKNLRAFQKTSFPKTNTLRNIHFNLTGNMWRYVWSMNGTVLSKADIIKIKKGETVRIHLHNTTMMHHPMHLHGHFFRVLNKQGEYSPLKHTVDVPPMKTITIEFAPDEKGDWMFHCHVLYHMKSGMSRVFRNGEKRDSRLKNYPADMALNMDNHWHQWGEIKIMSNRGDLEAITSNTKNKITLEGTFSWMDDYYNFHKNTEWELSYERFTNDFFRFYAGAEAENTKEGVIEDIEDLEIIGKAGVRYLLPYFFEGDVNIDHKARFQIALEYELLIFPRTELFAEWEWTVDLGLINPLPEDKIWDQKHEWSVGLSYMISKSFSFIGSYSNHFSYGAGLKIKL